MRIVTTPNFCKVCAEGLWLALLKRVDLIDDVVAGCVQDDESGHWTRTLDAQLVPLAELREHAVAPAESYTITWSKDGKVLDAFTNKTRLEVPDADAAGEYTLDVTYATEEVIIDKDGLLSSGGEFTITESCGPPA